MAKPTRNRILDVAEDQFARSGFDGATTRGVASSAGCNVALISYYFGGKQGLYEELLARHFSRVRAEFERFMSDPKYTDDFLEKSWSEFGGNGARAKRMRYFAALMNELYLALVSNPEMTRIVWRELISGGKVAARVLSRPESGALPLLRLELEKLKKEKLLSQDLDVRHAVVALAGPAIYSMLAWPVIRSTMGFKTLDAEYIRSQVLYQVRSLFDGWSAS
jgi:AcrR family transcriptional regulator